MIQRGKLMVDIAHLSQENIHHFFRLSVVAPSVTEEDLDFILDEIAEISSTTYNNLTS